jgi:hypothetical protein
MADDSLPDIDANSSNDSQESAQENSSSQSDRATDSQDTQSNDKQSVKNQSSGSTNKPESGGREKDVSDPDNGIRSKLPGGLGAAGGGPPGPSDVMGRMGAGGAASNVDASQEEGDVNIEDEAVQDLKRLTQVAGQFLHAIAELLGNTAVQVLLVAALVLFGVFIYLESTNQTVGPNPNSCVLGTDCGALSSTCPGASGGSTTTTPSTPGGVSTSGLNASAGEAVAKVAYKAGFRGDDLIEMVAIAYPESSWNPTAENGAPKGLWEEESTEGIPGNWQDPQVNADRALKYWQSASGADPGSGNTLPAPDFTTSATQYVTAGPGGQAYLAGTHYAPWYDFSAKTGKVYEQGLALTNKDIAQWVPNWNKGTTPGSGSGTSTSGTAPVASTSSCCPGGGATGSTTLTGSNLQQQEYNFFVSQGFSKWGAAALAGDMEGEGSNPFVAEEGHDPHNNTWPDSHPTGPSNDILQWYHSASGFAPLGWGIVQWTATREQEVGAFLRNINPDLYQSQYTNQEHKDYGSNGVDQLSSAVGTTLTEAALSGELQFELVELKKYDANSGESIYAELQNVNSEPAAMTAVSDIVANYEHPSAIGADTILRQGYARSIYSKYSSDSVSSASSTPTSTSGTTTSSTSTTGNSGNTGTGTDTTGTTSGSTSTTSSTTTVASASGCSGAVSSGGGAGIAQLATLIGKANNGWSGHASTNAPSLVSYVNKAVQVGGGTPPPLWASCDVSVALVVRNTVDPNIPWSNVSAQYAYFTGAGKSKWTLVKNGEIEPGDIANAGSPASDHTFIYLDPATDTIYDGSLGTQVGLYQHGYPATRTNAQGEVIGESIDGGEPFHIFRYTGG